MLRPTSIFRVLLLLFASVTFTPGAFAQRGQIVQGQITSDALTNNFFGDRATKPFKVYLPPSYNTTSNRYPVIYVLHGYTGNESDLIATSPAVPSAIQPALDAMIAKRTSGEMIAVFVNGANRLNGSFYLNSPAIGDYETYIAKDLVNLIDSRYRTLNSRESRGITGYSMGGWGAMHLALKFPTIFSVVVAEAGLYDSRSTWADGLQRQLVQIGPTNLSQFAKISFPANAMQALFAGLLPNPQRPSLFTDYPYEKLNNQLVLVDSAHQRCLAGDVQHGDLERYVAQPVRLSGIKLVHGTTDSIVPISEPRQFTNALVAAGIPYSYEEHSGDHIYRADLALPFLSSHLQGAQPYITPPKLNLADATNSVRLTFPTQAGVTYMVESTGAVESSNWAEAATLSGDGQAASVSFPKESKLQFFRVRAANNAQ